MTGPEPTVTDAEPPSGRGAGGSRSAAHPDGEGTGHQLGGGDAAIDAALAALYDSDRDPAGERAAPARGGGLNASAPRVARWLGDIRRYFPSTVVQVMQADAIERLNLARLLLEPEMLDAVEPDIHLVGTLLSLNRVMPERSKRAARAVVAKVVADLRAAGRPAAPGRR